MGLIAVDASTDNVNFGSAAGIDDVQEGTLLWRFRPASVANATRYGWAKAAGGATGFICHKQVGDGTTMRMLVNRATADMIRATVTGTFVANVPYKVAVTWSISTNTINWYVGVIGAGSMVAVGDTLTAGSGAYVSDAASSLTLGDPAGTSIAWGAEWYEAALFKSVLALGDCNTWGEVPHGTGAEAFWRFGKTGATAVDETGNGYDGTVTTMTQTSGSTVVGRRPIFGGGKLFSPALIR